MQTMSRRASQPQFDLIKRLLTERELDSELQNWVAVAREAATKGHLSMTRCKMLIDALIAAPKKQAERTSAEEPQAGVYEDTDGNLFRVYFGQQSGRMLVQQILVEHWELRVVDVEYKYLGAAARKLPKDAVRLPLERVGKLGIATGSCLICGRRLDVPESVDRGIGPVCAERY